MYSKFKTRRRQLGLYAVIVAYSLMGCATGSFDSKPKVEMVGVSIGAVGHFGARMGIPEFFVDGRWGGNNTGWGGGGAGVCCVPLPAKVTGPVLVNVKWESCDTRDIQFVNGRAVDPNARCKLENHEATVPVHFEVEPGKGGFALVIHFFPGGQLEAWYTRSYPEARNYPGPKFPRGPAPPSIPFSSRILGDTASPLQGGHLQDVQP
jgi:hypothetical protein